MIVPKYLTMLFCMALPVSALAQRDSITLEDIWTKGTFRQKSVPGFTALKSGKQYSAVETDSLSHIHIYDLATGKKTKPVFEGKMPNSTGAIETYAFSPDEKRLLLFSEGQNIYRRSFLYRVAVYDIASGRFMAVDTGKILHASFSPDGSKIGFVKDNNLYYRDLEKQETVAVTTDGERNRIINGNCDWVYEEEFEFTQAYQWSPDSKRIAYYRFDETAVPEYSFARYGSGDYPEEYRYKYPKAGEANSIVTIHIYDLNSRNAATVSGAAEYTPRIEWSADPEKLCVLRMNRWQNQLDYVFADAQSGSTETFLTESDPAYVEVNDNRAFLPDNRSMVYTSERAGWNELWRWDWKKKRHTRLSTAGMDVEGITAIDTPRGIIYFTAAPRTVDRQLYAVRFDGKGLRRITSEEGTHAITAAGSAFFLDQYSRLGIPSVFRLLNSDGRVVRTLEDNSALRTTMSRFNLGNIRLLKLDGAPLVQKLAKGKAATPRLNAWMITPPGFDSNRRYPVLMFQYSGPGSQQVADRFPTADFFWHQMLAQKGYIVVCADGTGTGFRGAEFKKRTYLQLGRYESDDQIAVARNLSKLSFVDKERIGIWGWSFGGFMSSTCLFKAPDEFKMGISVAPVTNWRYYDNVYTERYLRRPQDNPQGYDENAPVSKAKDLKGPFLLVHGTADDNVHFQNSVMLVDELIRRGKSFDSEYYPNKAHGISGGTTRLHLYRRMTNFVLKNL
jgi:dipeptidyl-peptidase-4